MTPESIDKELERQRIIHETASKVVEIIIDASKEIRRMGGDADAAYQRMMELINDPDG